MSRYADSATEATPRARPPGVVLLSSTAMVAVTLLVLNDLWLKPHHPGWLSGKLSDVALCILLPLYVHAAIEWGAWATGRLLPAWSVWVSFALGLGYFCAVKCLAPATETHMALMHRLLGGEGARAVTDPTDLMCLPFALAAWRTIHRATAQTR